MRDSEQVIITESLPGGPLDPTADESLPPDQRTGSAIGIDATYPYGTLIKKVGDLRGPALEEHGGQVVEVADIPGWTDYDFPELDAR